MNSVSLLSTINLDEIHISLLSQAYALSFQLYLNELYFINNITDGIEKYLIIDSENEKQKPFHVMLDYQQRNCIFYLYYYNAHSKWKCKYSKCNNDPRKTMF